MDAQGWGREVTRAAMATCRAGSARKISGIPTNFRAHRAPRRSSSARSLASRAYCARMAASRSARRGRASCCAPPDRPSRMQLAARRTQRIGNRPDLRQLISKAFETNTWTGLLFTGVVPAGQTLRWFSASWPAHWHVIWTIVPTTPQAQAGSPQIRYSIQTERQSDGLITYWIAVSNLSSASINFEARYAVLGW